MFFGDIKYDPVRDLQPVDSTGAVDLAKAHAMGSLPSNIESGDLLYNEIDDPRSIGARPSDVFEAAQASKAISGYVPPKANAAE